LRKYPAPPRSIVARRARTRGGFTLIELIAVLVVIAIMAGVAMPALSSLGTTRARAAHRQLIRDLSFARQRAVATGSRSWVVFSTVDQTWTVKAESSATPGRASAAVLTDPGTGKPMTQALNIDPFPGVQITAVNFNGGSEVGFNWLGCPLNVSETSLSAAGSVTLTGGLTVNVTIGTGTIF
jgi:prepilin-type N-terminal cleavage/methylation domain-containing protein